ncbi:MAG: site-2 protease family protein [Proteobacteria bacterium]|jgi:Zn-dependent protease|nr:site-2 protease family protein [Pseudomonadota bacterium]
MGLSDLTIQLIAFRVVASLILIGVHGGIVAATAVYLGDKGPKYDGRLTIAPSNHIDLVGTISLVICGLGWSKPVELDPRLFRMKFFGTILVILSGFVGLLLMASVFDALIVPALTTLPFTAGLVTAAFLRAAGNMSVWFALFSLLPIPPLTGWTLLKLLNIRISTFAYWVLCAMLIVAIATGLVSQVLGPVHAVLSKAILVV